MIKKIWQALFPKTEPLVISLPEKPHYWTEDEDSIRALASNPGFVSLTYRFAAQAAILSAKLNQTTHKDIREVDRLQSGLFWLSYLQSEVNKLVFKKTETRSVSLPPTEAEQFEHVLALIESV